jgi:hypothetical protein
MVLQSPSEQGTASVDDIERYEVIDGVRLAREPMGAFETVLASWLCHLISILQRTDTFEPKPIHAVVVRTWNGHEYGHGGKTVLLTHAPVDKPLQPFDDDDACNLIENCCIKEAEQP